MVIRITVLPCDVLGYGPIKLSAMTSQGWYDHLVSHTGVSLLVAWLSTGTDGTHPNVASNILPHGNPEEPLTYGLVGFCLS